MLKINFSVNFQITEILITINKITAEAEMTASTIDILQSFYIQINLQPITFTTAGFYTINLPFLAGIFTGIASYQSKRKLSKFNV